MISRIANTLRMTRTIFYPLISRGLLTQNLYKSPKMLNFLELRRFADFPSHTKLTMPSLSPTMAKGKILKWTKKEGDKLGPGDVICDVETDKATVGFEVQESGYLAKILVPEGSANIQIGTLVAIMAENESDIKKFENFSIAEKSTPSEAKPESKQVGKEEVKEPKKAEPLKEELVQSKDYHISISPAAKALAEKNKLDWTKINGTGPRGRIVKGDIEEALNQKPSMIYLNQEKPIDIPPYHTPQPPRPKIVETAKAKIEVKETVAKEEKVDKKVKKGKEKQEKEYQDIELTTYKRVSAERLTLSKQTIPHYYVSIEVEMDEMLKLRSELNEISKTKISINDMLIKIAAVTCVKVPESNSSWMGEFIRQYKDCNLCFAINTPQVLAAPLIEKANLKGFSQIASESKALIEKAKAGKLSPTDIDGGTFTISNAGMYGLTQLISVINPPQSCILGISQVEKKFVVVDNPKEGQNPWRVASKMTVSLSCDHRVVDGAIAAKWVSEFKKICENPKLLLI